MSETPPILSFDRVSMGYEKGKDIFSRVSFKLHPGSFHFLMGPSGAGKSTLLKLMYLGHRDYRGTIRIFGRSCKTLLRHELPTFRQQIGIVFQEPFLLEHLSAIENVALPLRVRGVNGYQAQKRAREILKWVELDDSLLTHPVSVLSGGEKQRIGLARAIIAQPRLLLADEPTGSVDERISEKLMYLFEELNRLGMTIVLATHNTRLVHAHPFPILRLQEGHVAEIPVPTLATLKKASNG